MRTHRYRALLALVAAAVGLTTATGQNPDPKDPKTKILADFDIRDFKAELKPEELNEAAVLVAQRDAALATMQSSSVEVQLGTRIVPNAFGLPKIYRREGNVLSPRSLQKPEQVARGFLQDHRAVLQLSPAEVDNLRVLANDITDSGAFIAFNQTVGAVDVFNAQIKFTLTRAGEVVQVAGGDVVPGLSLPTTPALSALAAAETAIQSIGAVKPDLKGTSDLRNGSFTNPRGLDYAPVSAELVIFPMTASSARLAYRVFFEASSHAWYELLIDANTGALLFRHNLYKSSGQARVWQQSPAVGERALVNLADSWLPASATTTTGNNVDAYIDVNGDDVADPLNSAGMVNGHAMSPTQVFDFPFGDGTVSMNPRGFQPAAVTNLFYMVNVAHDYYYNLGFTEAAGNFQTDNLGRGGAGSDAVKAEAQFGDLNGNGFTENAEFAPTPDGTPPKMRMGLFTLGTNVMTDDLDSDYDGQVVIHEYGHGVSTRLVGARTSTSCLSRIQSGALGEGWSDYFAISFYNNPVHGAYLTQNSVKGVRRQSYEGYTFTYEDLGNEGFEVHNDGEIWAATLWDLRKTLGQTATDRLVMDGLKATPCNPSMTDARDAILSADQAANAGANRTAIWTVFARHGLGYSAFGTDGNVLTGTRYDAAYDLPPSSTPTNPTITSNPLLLHTSLGDQYRYTIAASNPAGGAVTFVLTSGPAGMTVDATTGVVSWPASFFSQRVKVTVSDTRGGKVVHGYLLAVSTTLGSNVPIIITGVQDSEGYATITVPANTPVLQVRLRGGSGDADLTITDPDGGVSISARAGNTETLSFANPKSGKWTVEVDGYRAYSDLSLNAVLITPTLVGLNSTISNLSGETSSETFYRVTLPNGISAFTISTTNGQGNSGTVLIFVRRGAPAVCQATLSVLGPCLYDYVSSLGPSAAKSVSVNNPASGDWYITLYSVTSYTVGTFRTTTTVTPVGITLTNGGAGVVSTLGATPDVTTAYATAGVNGIAPAGTAVFIYSQNGITVSEAGIPASAPTQSARIFVDYRTGVASGSGTINIYTGLAIVNRGASTATVTYILRDRGGAILATGHGDLTAGAHRAKFIQELRDIAPDFILPGNFPTSTQYGSLEVASTQPVSVLALRLTPNQRGDVLLTSTPIADTAQPLSTSPVYFPQLADGGGYTTSVVLLNTSSVSESGVLSIFDDSGSPLNVRSTDGVTASSFPYSISAAGTFVFHTDGSPAAARVGWVRVTPDSGSNSPIGAGVFSYSQGGVLVTESGVPSAVPTTRARIYVDKSGGHDTGLAVATPSVAGDIAVTAFKTDGFTTAGGPAILKVAANGHKSAFAGELISSLPSGFTGVAELTSGTPFVALTLRSLKNSRGDFLLTTFPIADANQSPPSPLVFPHIANGGGYSTQFIFVSATSAVTVNVSFWTDSGDPLGIEHNP